MAPTVWHVIVPGRLLGGCSRHYQSWHFQIGVGAESKDRDKRSYGRRRHREPVDPRWMSQGLWGGGL